MPGFSNEELMSACVTSQEFPPPPDLTSYVVKIDDQYSNGGSFGDVYRCWYYGGEDAPKEVAVKAFRFRLTMEEDASNQSAKMIRRELGIWRRLNHNNIVPFLGIAYGFGMRGAVSLVSLWMPNNTLHSFLAKHDHSLSVVCRLQLLLDIANGLHYLHSFPICPIVHGDLNCNNVLLDTDYTARLADFGYASLVGNIPEALTYLQMSTTRPGALRWTAPELVVSEDALNRTTKSDIYSFGCISLQVLSGEQPWSEVQKDASVLLHLVQGHKPGRPKFRAIDNQHWDFIQECWMSIQDRPTAADIITSLQQFLSHYPQFLPLHDFMSTTQADFVVSSNDPSFDPSSLVPIDDLDANIILLHRDEGCSIEYSPWPYPLCPLAEMAGPSDPSSSSPNEEWYTAPSSPSSLSLYASTSSVSSRHSSYQSSPRQLPSPRLRVVNSNFSPIFHCEWERDNGEVCGELITKANVPQHLSQRHELRNMAPDRSHGVRCMWRECRRKGEIPRMSIVRHVREVHLNNKRAPV